ncbi:hypothetical protein LAJ19_15490 (plasmid) [Deinococcus taeanensis]|uniref:hypothetical protein n=1 Tax=Deinococcus taeanensis TaxID=2737050 RepID=UPI001CDC3023|nr:hypothetical protein [Deinococcus taeanensis]UBV44202.1 hypothetical protein LAJ19_15490 [Deinococcus taeanensis]
MSQPLFSVIQLLLPQYDNDGQPFAPALLAEVKRRLTDEFGGLTAYVRAPAAGLWKDGGDTVRDDVLVYEVMAGHLDRAWWASYRESLRRAFRQDALVIRAYPVEVL